MKFYRGKNDNYFEFKIIDNKLTAIYCKYFSIIFYKNGKWYNNKNAAFINDSVFKYFYLNGIYYGNKYKFTKQSSRRFVKMEILLLRKKKLRKSLIVKLLVFVYMIILICIGLILN